MIAPPFTARCSIVQRAFKATTLAMCWRSGSGGASARSTRKRKVRAMADRPDFHVITGGPGSGQSTLIEALAVEGFDHMPDAGRAIIRDQVAIGGAALPWADRAAFAELMLGWELRSWHEAHDRAGPVICDRSVPDVAGYLRLCGLPRSEDRRVWYECGSTCRSRCGPTY